ncbi:transglutaminase-like cysteine peptidase [Rhizobium sp. RU36D]|uniref:transglutaminase-like cysteine peptidase n=1 Tax=Rhizobium sp. RU36D TaxID=1907415 RepID=UPI0009D83AB2|nr:transglutaminase-like cysteine peptidase [Rhizobium sp. RU36D]SMC40392.1 Predicted transglutaminase-like cysteine proteinase [Rhizobium sp. RU36D]
MLKNVMTAAVFAATVLVWVTPAAAAGPGGLARNLVSNPTVSYIVAKKPFAGPSADVGFCAGKPSFCNGREDARAVVLTSHRESQLNRVNRSVNEAAGTMAAAGDVWKVGVTMRDGEDVALAKREKLISMGWSPRALQVAVVRTRFGEGRAVLVVKTSKGDLMLDSRTGSIRAWKASNLHLLEAQKGDRARAWYAM